MNCPTPESVGIGEKSHPKIETTKMNYPTLHREGQGETFELNQALNFDFPFVFVYFFLNDCLLECLQIKTSDKLLFHLILTCTCPLSL